MNPFFDEIAKYILIEIIDNYLLQQRYEALTTLSNLDPNNPIINNCLKTK